jgi:hypothetical protein
MKKTTSGFFAVLTLFSLQLMAVNPDFSGKWVRDQANR